MFDTVSISQLQRAAANEKARRDSHKIIESGDYKNTFTFDELCESN